MGPDLYNRKRPYSDFRKWYEDRSAGLGLDSNPFAPEHYYNYRGAYEAGDEANSERHWPSAFKLPGHPNLYINGVDTRDGSQVMPLSSPPQPMQPKRPHDRMQLLAALAGGLGQGAQPEGFFGNFTRAFSGSVGSGLQYAEKKHEQERQEIKDTAEANRDIEARRRWDASFGQDTQQLDETIRHNKATEAPKPDLGTTDMRDFGFLTEHGVQSGDAIERLWPKPRAAGAGGSGEEGPVIDDATLNSYAEGLATTGSFPNLGGFGKYGTKVKMLIGQRAVQRHPGLNLGKAAADYKANTAALSKMTQMRSGLDAFSDTMLSNMNILKEEATAIPEFGNRWMNAGARKAASVFGDPRVARFNTALETVVPEAARILQSGGSIGGAPLSDQQKKDLRAVLHGDFTRRQLFGSIDILKREVGNRKAAQDRQIETLRHRVEPSDTQAPDTSNDPLGVR